MVYDKKSNNDHGETPTAYAQFIASMLFSIYDAFFITNFHFHQISFAV